MTQMHKHKLVKFGASLVTAAALIWTLPAQAEEAVAADAAAAEAEAEAAAAEEESGGWLDSLFGSEEPAAEQGPTKAELDQRDSYMRNIVPVYFPAVPFGWKVIVGDDNSVSYIHTVGNSNNNGTIIKMRYTRKTSRMDAAAYMDHYVYQHSCTDKIKQGTGFYTTSCMTNNTYTIVVGEVDNMYIIELKGDYNAAARAIIENYVGNIVNGKKVFMDRNIGDMTTRTTSAAAQ